MLKPIRIKLPTKEPSVYKTTPINVATFRDLLLIRHQMSSAVSGESIIVANELLEDLFPDAPELFRPYIFLRVYCDSRGIDLVHIRNKCEFCGSDNPAGVLIRPNDIEQPKLTIDSGLTLHYNYINPSEIAELDFISIFERTIDSVEVEDDLYKWDSLDKQTQDAIIDLIDYSTFIKYITKLSVIPPFEIQRPNCCDKAKKVKQEFLEFQSFYELFMFLVNPDEIGLYYRSNKILVSNGFSLSDIEKMPPMEKSIILKLIEGELRRRSEANAAK